MKIKFYYWFLIKLNQSYRIFVSLASAKLRTEAPSPTKPFHLGEEFPPCEEFLLLEEFPFCGEVFIIWRSFYLVKEFPPCEGVSTL